MSPKKLEPKSRYAQYDLDGDGTLSAMKNWQEIKSLLRSNCEKRRQTVNEEWLGCLWVVWSFTLYYHLCHLSQNPVCPLWLL